MEKEIRNILVNTKKDFPLSKTDSIKVVDIKLAAKKIVEFLKENSKESH